MRRETKLFLMFITSILVHGTFDAVNGVSNTSKSYTAIVVSAAKLVNPNVKEELPAFSSIVCAMHAMHRSWSHLMCYSNQQCQLYDLAFTSKHQDTTNDVSYDCYTDLTTECESEGTIVEEGQSITPADDCIKRVCEDTTLQNFYPGSPVLCAVSSFIFVPGVGCILVKEDSGLVTYDTAVTTCSGFGGQLTIPEIFEALQDYLQCVATGWFWVSIVNSQWTDGQPIAASHWNSPTEPVYPSDCGLIASGSSGYFLKTNPCDWGHLVLCQLP